MVILIYLAICKTITLFNILKAPERIKIILKILNVLCIAFPGYMNLKLNLEHNYIELSTQKILLSKHNVFY